MDKYYDEIREEFGRKAIEFSKLVHTPSPLFKVMVGARKHKDGYLKE